ncbi:MAG: acyltransferase family protein [Candidatus Thorarchaeota archaeon]|nr:MAG: acyltransferase family protein [Candidatus Thorarchaeota archaeon]
MSEGNEVRKRLIWIDLSKGVGIVLVILAHSTVIEPSLPTIFISNFAIALFFFLGGLTYSSERYRNNLRYFIVSRGKQFLIPYFALYIIIMILFVPLASNVDTYLTPDQLLFWFLYGSGPPNQATHLWFLPVLYFGLVLFVLIDRAMHRFPHEARWILVVLLPAIGVAIRDYFFPVLVPWRVSSILVATAFCIIGHEVSRYRGLKSWTTGSKGRDLVLFIVCFVIVLLVSNYNWLVDFAVDRLGTFPLLYLVSGTFGTIMVFILCSTFEDSENASRIILPFGTDSQTIYEIHPVFFYIVPPLLVLLGWSAADIAANHVLLWPLRFIPGVVLSLLFAVYIVSKSDAMSFIFTGKRAPKK